MCTRVYLILEHATRRQSGETLDPLTQTSQTAKKARANEAKHESIQGKASAHIYILALALSRVLPAIVYSRHKEFQKNLETKFTFITQPWSEQWSCPNLIKSFLFDEFRLEVTFNLVFSVTTGRKGFDLPFCPVEIFCEFYQTCRTKIINLK